MLCKKVLQSELKTHTGKKQVYFTGTRHTDSPYLASEDGNSRQRTGGHRNSGLEGRVGVLQGNLNSNIKRLNVYHCVLQNVFIFIS